MKKREEENCENAKTQNSCVPKSLLCRCFKTLTDKQELTSISVEKPWWERELNFDQFNDLLNTWYSELPSECDLFHNFVIAAMMRDIQIYINAHKVRMLAGMANEVCVLQRELECQVEFMIHQLPEVNNKIEELESKYSGKLYLDCSRLPIYEKLVFLDLKTKQMEQDFADMYEQLKSVKNKIDFEQVSKIVSILNAQANTMNTVASKIKETEATVKHITELHEMFVSMIRLSLQSHLANIKSQ